MNDNNNNAFADVKNECTDNRGHLGLNETSQLC